MRWHCGLCGEWIDYSPEVYGIDGPVPLHFLLTHESNQSAAVNDALTVGLMSQKGAVVSAPEPTVDPYENVARHLRLNGHGALADRLEDILADIEIRRGHVLDHYQSVLGEAVAS